MGQIEVNATYSGTKDNPIDPVQATFGVEDGGDINGAISLYGDQVVFGQFQKGLKTTARNALRGQLSGGLSSEEALAKMEGWQPGVSLERSIDPMKALQSQFASMTKEEKASRIKEIQALADAA